MPFEKKEEVKLKKKEFNISNSDHFTILRAYNVSKNGKLDTSYFYDLECLLIIIFVGLEKLK